MLTMLQSVQGIAYRFPRKFFKGITMLGFVGRDADAAAAAVPIFHADSA